jgi:hypothetical protein
VGWSAWALTVMPAEVWASALALPFTQKPSWLLALGVLALGFPWSPLAVLAASRSVRAGWSSNGSSLVFGWLQASGACLVAGTVIPGLATAAKVPALAGLAIASGAVLDCLMTCNDSTKAKRVFLVFTVAVALVWSAIVFVGGGYLAAAVSFYRPLIIGVLVISPWVVALAVVSARKRDVRGAFVAILAVAVMLKVAHRGYYVSEWNYRLSQGPWGRAVGQWVPPGWPIYTLHSWRTDFAFATGHPCRQLLTAQHLKFQPDEVRFVLLLQSEFENWDEHAGAIESVATFQDEYGGTRILARTPGELPWSLLRRQIPAE